jgi:hypothetical protein
MKGGLQSSYGSIQVLLAEGKETMPQIIVTAGSTDDLGDTKVLLRERVNAADFESDRFAANLLERLGWAVEDATSAEKQGFVVERETLEQPQQRAPELVPDRDPEPVGA